jgi:hypothetical protein
MRIRLLFMYRDWWVGFAWNAHHRSLLVQPLPCVGVLLEQWHPVCEVCGKPPPAGAPGRAYQPWRHWDCVKGRVRSH